MIHFKIGFVINYAHGVDLLGGYQESKNVFLNWAKDNYEIWSNDDADCMLHSFVAFADKGIEDRGCLNTEQMIDFFHCVLT